MSAVLPPFGSPAPQGGVLPAWTSTTRTILLYTKSGTDALPTDAIPETGALYTTTQTETLVDILFTNGATPIVPDDNNFAEFVVSTSIPSTPGDVTTQTSGFGGTGNIAAGATVHFLGVGFSLLPESLPSGTTLTFAENKANAGVVLGPYTISIIVRP